MQEMQQENKLGTMPVPQLLMSMSVPIMISMLIQALYNVVDSIFVTRVSEDALTAVSLAFPVQAMMIAISVGTAIGVNAILSRRLGEKNHHDANLTAINGVFLAIVSAIAFAVFGAFGVEAFFSVFVESGAVMEMGISYTSIVSIFSAGLFVSIIGERLVQATGNSIYSMVSQMAGAITNIILDPILIFGLLGMPRLEVVGAAIATVIGQFVSMMVIIYFNLTKNPEIQLSFRGFRPNRRIIIDIYRIGLPSIFMQAIGSVMTFGMNKILILFSQTAVSVFGIYFKLQSFIFMPIFGLNSGMIPIIGYNFGARHRDRITRTIELGCVYSLIIMGIGFLIFRFGPEWLLVTLFEASPQMLEIGVPALKIVSLHFLPAAISIVLSGAFQALDRGVYSLGMSACRQLLVLLPSAYLLGSQISLEALWYCFPIAEIVCLVLALFLYRKLYREQIKTLGQP